MQKDVTTNDHTQETGANAKDEELDVMPESPSKMDSTHLKHASQTTELQFESKSPPESTGSLPKESSALSLTQNPAQNPAQSPPQIPTQILADENRSSPVEASALKSERPISDIANEARLVNGDSDLSVEPTKAEL